MQSYSVTIYFEPDGFMETGASVEVNIDAESEDDAIAQAEKMQVLGYSAELNLSDDPALRP
jgi:hypothetical protein